MREIREPFRYEPSGDCDGEHVGTDHFVLDANGEELACAPNEKVGLLFAASPDLLEACRLLVAAMVSDSPIQRADAVELADAAIAKAKGGVR